MRFCSIDIGKKNFCFYIEEISDEHLSSLQKLPEKNPVKEKRYNEDGTPTEVMTEILREVGVSGKTLLHINQDLTKGTDTKKYLDKAVYYNMVTHLDNYKEILDTVDIFVIEQQLARNSMATKLGQHCLSYFIIKYPDKLVVEFPSYNKTCVLGAQKIRGKKYKNGRWQWKTMDKPTRKKWAVTKCLEILTERGEEETMTNIRTKAKKDDLSDTVCQLSAFKYLYFVCNEKF